MGINMIHSKMITKKVKIISLVFALVVLLLGAVSAFAMNSNNKNTNDSYSIFNEGLATSSPQRDEKLAQFKMR